MKRLKRRHIIFFLLLAFIIVWSLILYFKGPEELIRMIGVQNGYIISFFVGLFGGVATLSSISYYPVIGTFAAGGLHPLLLGLIAGGGLTIGQSLYFYFGHRGRVVLSQKNQERLKRVRAWIDKKPDFLVRMLLFLYVGFTPLPNTLLTGIGGLVDYSFKKIIWPLALGNFVITVMISHVVVLSMS